MNEALPRPSHCLISKREMILLGSKGCAQCHQGYHPIEDLMQLTISNIPEWSFI